VLTFDNCVGQSRWSAIRPLAVAQRQAIDITLSDEDWLDREQSTSTIAIRHPQRNASWCEV
jgi:hypothetical protein